VRSEPAINEPDRACAKRKRRRSPGTARLGGQIRHRSFWSHRLKFRTAESRNIGSWPECRWADGASPGARLSNYGRTRLGYCMVLLARPATDTDRSHYFPLFFERNSSCKNHNASLIRGVNTEELAPRLGM